MSSKFFCDRCHKEMFNKTVLHIQIRTPEGFQPWEICEECSVELRHWVEEYVE